MNQWTYISPGGRFEMQLPVDWAEYEDEPNVSAFFDATTWTGNLRITHIFLKEPTRDHVARTEQFIKGIVAEHSGAEQKILGTLVCAHFQEQIVGEDDEPTIIYYWLGVYEHHRMACSFTAPEENGISSERERTLKIVEEIISSIRLYPEEEL